MIHGLVRRTGIPRISRNSAYATHQGGLVLWYGLGRPVITSEIGNWSVFVLLGWRLYSGLSYEETGESRIVRCHHDSGNNKAAPLLRLLISKVSNHQGQRNRQTCKRILCVSALNMASLGLWTLPFCSLVSISPNEDPVNFESLRRFGSVASVPIESRPCFPRMASQRSGSSSPSSGDPYNSEKAGASCWSPRTWHTDGNFGLCADDTAPRSFAPCDSGRRIRVRTRREVRLEPSACCAATLQRS